MKRIMILHPEGNINTNPNLTGIVEILCEHGYSVDIYSRRRPEHSQDPPCEGAHIVLSDVADPLDTAILLSPEQLSSEEAVSEIGRKYCYYDLIIGIDLGIVESSRVAAYLKIPYGLISYEIYFGEEKGNVFKLPEISACRDLAFAVCQDRTRARHLSVENHIALDRIIDIPVAGRTPVVRERSYAFHDALGIPRAKKICLYMGSISRCLGTAELMESTDSWDDDWALVMHVRFGQVSQAFRDYFGPKKNVYYSNFLPFSFREIHQLTNAADVGLAFYTPIVQPHANTGLNIQHTGMASGKISTYLQHDLPIIINEMGEMSDHVRNHSLGRVISDISNLGRTLAGLPDQELKQLAGHGHRFFRSHLDLNETIQPLLHVLALLT